MACGCSHNSSCHATTPPPTETAPPVQCNCYVMFLSAGYAGALLDLEYDGKTPISQVQDLPKPNAHTYALGLDALPTGYFWDAVNELLYFPINYQPTALAFWTKSPTRDAMGCFTWHAEPVEACVQVGDCETLAKAKYDAMQTPVTFGYWCLDVDVLTSDAALLAHLQAVYGQAVTLAFSQTGRARFQLLTYQTPAPFTGDGFQSTAVTTAWTAGACTVFPPPAPQKFCLEIDYLLTPTDALNAVIAAYPNGATVPAIAFDNGTGRIRISMNNLGLPAPFTGNGVVTSAVLTSWIADGCTDFPAPSAKWVAKVAYSTNQSAAFAEILTQYGVDADPHWEDGTDPGAGNSGNLIIYAPLTPPPADLVLGVNWVGANPWVLL